MRLFTKKKKKESHSPLEIARWCVGGWMRASEIEQNPDGSISVFFNADHPYYNHNNIRNLVKQAFIDRGCSIELAEFANHVAGHYVEVRLTVIR